MKLLVALLLAQNVNVTPIESRQAGARLSNQRQYVIDCRSNMTCATDGGILYLSSSGGSSGGKVAEAYAADASITAQTATWASTADASVTAVQLAADPTACGAGNYVTDISAAGVLTCSTPPGTYTLPDSTSLVTGGIRLTGDLGGTATSPSVVDDSHAHTGTTISSLDASDITSGTLSQARGGTGAAALTCTSGQALSSNGTAYSCTSTLTASDVACSGQCVGVAEVVATGTPSATTYLRGDGTWSTPAGGSGGSPGGSHGSVQYFTDAGTFGGMSGLGTDGTDLIFTDRSTHMTNPAVGQTGLYFFDHYGSGGPGLPQVGSATLDFDIHLNPTPFTRSDDAWWACVIPATWGSTTINTIGRAIAGGATGTAAAVAWASTDERTRNTWVQYPSATTASQSAGYRANTDYMWRGNAAGIGGWLWNGAFNIVTTTANQRLFVGLKDATAVITATTNPSAALDTVYFGCDAGQTTIRICSNDNSGAATCTDLGANFPCTTANTAYDVALWSAANGSSIGYWIRRLVNGSTASGTISSDLPRNTVALGWDFWINNGGTAAASTIQFGGTCWWANP